MKRTMLIALISIASLSSAYADGHLKQRAMQSKEVVKEFMGQLKGELKSAMEAGGPVNAINVCKDKAPTIAADLSKKYNWTVARTSLKTRNPDNAPDLWEERVLQEFEVRKNDGEDVKAMAYFAEVDEKGEKSFRFMKAIPTGEVCLKCHGKNLAPEVSAKLKETYPEDKATGFKLGDIRGAFTITQPVN